MDKCRRVGHNYEPIGSGDGHTKEKCADCGHIRTFRSKDRGFEKDFGEEHHRDFIQPVEKEDFEIAYGKDFFDKKREE